VNEPTNISDDGLHAEPLLALYRISDEDIDRVRICAKSVMPHLDEIVGRWYEWLEDLPEYQHFFDDPVTVKRVKLLQHKYWLDFLGADVDERYVESRKQVGEAHARIGLSLNTYFAGMNMFLEVLFDTTREAGKEAQQSSANAESLAKLLHLDTAIVVATYNRLVEESLTEQAKSLLEMSTPVTQIWEGVLLLPIVGIIDSRRARDVMNATLAKISETQARIFILDISGVGVVDTAVANHLIKITRATRLMGCACTISGVSPQIAQTIVDLGIDLGGIQTTATMRDALADAFRRVGMTIGKE